MQDLAVAGGRAIPQQSPCGIAEGRIDQIRATLERCRWVMHDLPPQFLLVNVAGFQVFWIQNGENTWESAAVYHRDPAIVRGLNGPLVPLKRSRVVSSASGTSE